MSEPFGTIVIIILQMLLPISDIYGDRKGGKRQSRQSRVPDTMDKKTKPAVQKLE